VTALQRAALAAICLVGGATAARGQHEDIAIFSTLDGGGLLTTPFPFATPQLLTPSLPGGACPGGVCPYSSTNPGFDTADGDLPAQSLFALAPSTPIAFTVVTIAAGAAVRFGSTVLDAAGESTVIGSSDLHVHPTWQLSAPVGILGEWPVTFRLTSSAPSYAASAPFTIVLTNAAAATPTQTATSTSTATASASPPLVASPTDSPSPTPTATAEVLCAPTPRDCPASGRAMLALKRIGEPSRQSLTFRWTKGTIASPAEFADPTQSTPLALCLYADAVLIADYTVEPGGAWRPTSGGFVYVRKGGNADAVSKVVLSHGDGSAKVLVRGRGAALPTPSGGLPLASGATITAQLARDGGICWGAPFAAPALRSDGTTFIDRR
jgi:hypothetical protein